MDKNHWQRKQLNRKRFLKEKQICMFQNLDKKYTEVDEYSYYSKKYIQLREVILTPDKTKKPTSKHITFIQDYFWDFLHAFKEVRKNDLIEYKTSFAAFDRIIEIEKNKYKEIIIRQLEYDYGCYRPTTVLRLRNGRNKIEKILKQFENYLSTVPTCIYDKQELSLVT